MGGDPETFATFGRFVEPAFLILISLADGPKHGYAMMEDIEQLSTIRLGAGTLYGAIARLEQHGLINDIPSTDRRRPYQLTEAGRSRLQLHLLRLQQMSTIGLQRLAAV